jgi:hypothetical protein
MAKQTKLLREAVRSKSIRKNVSKVGYELSPYPWQD